MQASQHVKFYTMSGRTLNSKEAKTWYKQATGDATGKKMAGWIGGKILEGKWNGNVLYQRVGCSIPDKHVLQGILEQLRDPDEDGNYPITDEEELVIGKLKGIVTYSPIKSRRKSR